MTKVRSLWLFLLLLTNTIGLQAQDPAPVSTDSSNPQKKYFVALPPEEPEKDAEDLMKEAIIHFDGGRYKNSIECLNKAIEINEFPQLSDILYYYRAVSQAKMKAYTMAISDYSNAIAINPRKSKYFYHRGLAYFQNSNFDEARKDFEKTLTMTGANADIYIKLGFLKQQENDLKGAIADYTKAIELNPKSSNPYYYRGLIYLQVLLHDKACEDLKKASNLGHQGATRQYDKYCGQ